MCHKLLSFVNVDKYAAVLASSSGRGVLYLLVGGLSLGQWRVTVSSSDRPGKMMLSRLLCTVAV